MAKAIKILFAVIAGLILLLAIAIFIITRVIDPNDFKPEIAAAAKDNANLTLDMPGQLAWTFWPTLGVSLGKTEVRIGDDEELFAAIDEALVGVAVLPLLFGSVEMDQISVSGLQLNLVEDANGANWERIAASEAPAADTSAEAPAEQSSTLDIPVSIPSLSINDANVRYRVLTDGTDITIEHASIQAQNVSLTEPFPLQVALRYQDQSDIRIDTSVDTILSMNLDSNLFTLSPLSVKADIAGVTTLPVSVETQLNVEAALDEDRVSITDLLLTAAGTRTRGNITVAQLSSKMKFSGDLHVEPFDANKALQAIGEAPIDTALPQALSAISLDATIGGPENALLLNPLTIKIDSSTLSGSAGLADLDSAKIVFDLSLDELKADGYLPPETEEADSAPGAVASNTSSGILPPLSDAELLPLADLRSLLVDGKLKIGKLSLMDIHASDMLFAVSAENGLMKLTQAQGKALNGSFTASAALDARTDAPVYTFNKTVTGMQIQPVMQMALDDDLFTGVLDMQLDFKSQGNSEKALVDNAGGNTTFTLKDGTVRGANLHNTLLNGFNDLLGSYRELMTLLPDQNSGQMPLELSEDTKIIDLSGAAHLEKSVAYIDKLDAQLNRGSFNGNGFLNLRSQDFDLRLGMKSPELSSNKYLKDQTWPLRCAGNLEGDVADWCGHDKDGFKQIGKKVAAQLATDKLKDKLGIEGKGDTAEEVVKDAAKQKAKEEAQKAIDDRLKKLFK